MSNPENIIANLAKKPAIAITVALLSGFSLGILFEKIKLKLKHAETSVSTISTSHLAQYGEIPIQCEVTKEELLKIMKEYTKFLNDKKILENVIPRVFIEEKDLSSLSNNLEYAKDGNDLHALNKVDSDLLI